MVGHWVGDAAGGEGGGKLRGLGSRRVHQGEVRLGTAAARAALRLGLQPRVLAAAPAPPAWVPRSQTGATPHTPGVTGTTVSPVAPHHPRPALAPCGALPCSGYTAKVAGTKQRVPKPEATFSACFGSDFLVW